MKSFGKIWVILALMAALAAGCATTDEQIVGDGYELTEVSFTGVTRFSKGFIIDYIHAGETTWIPLTPDFSHDSGLLLADARRIEALYRSHGYYEAAVTGVHPTFDEKDREAKVVFDVFEGRPTRVDAIHYQWRNPPEDLVPTVESQAEIEAEGTFEVGKFNASQGKMRRALLNAGYPLAMVRGDVKVNRKDRTANVTFKVDPGPPATIGNVRIEGLVYVPEYLVQNEIEFVVDQPYSPRRMQQIENAIKAMRVFRWVAVEPPTEVVDGKTQIVVRVSEADPHSIKIGGELKIDTYRWQEQAKLRYTNTNVFGHLTRLDLLTVGGLAQIPNPFQPDLTGPVFRFRPKFSKKGLLERHLHWSITPQYRLDLQQGYKYHDVSERFAVSRWFLGSLRLEVNHLIRYVNFFEVSPTLDANDSLLGRDFRDPYLLSQAGFRAQLFFVDSISKPKNGAIVEAGYAIAAKEIASEYSYQKTTFQTRGYWQLTDWMSTAARLQTGLILPFGEFAGAPFDRKFYLGGANSVRGWGTRRLSPRVEDCDPETGECDSVPVGGYTMVSGNAELRFNVFGPVFLVGFFDMGDVQAEELTYNVDEWNYSAGPGMRIDTPIGKIRLDVGFRLNDPGVYPDEAAWALYFGFGEAI